MIENLFKLFDCFHENDRFICTHCYIYSLISRMKEKINVLFVTEIVVHA